MDLFITTAHRISCSILQRTAQEDEAVTDKVKQTDKIQLPKWQKYNGCVSEGCTFAD